MQSSRHLHSLQLGDLAAEASEDRQQALPSICRDKGLNFKGSGVILVKQLEVTLKGVKIWTATQELS